MEYGGALNSRNGTLVLLQIKDNALVMSQLERWANVFTKGYTKGYTTGYTKGYTKGVLKRIHKSVHKSVYTTAKVCFS